MVLTSGTPHAVYTFPLLRWTGKKMTNVVFYNKKSPNLSLVGCPSGREGSVLATRAALRSRTGPAPS